MDEDLFIDVSYTNDVDVTLCKVVLYNGINRIVYNTIQLPKGTLVDGGTIDMSVATASIQNGIDSMAIVTSGGNVIKFLSYEGAFKAADGPAEGTRSKC